MKSITIHSKITGIAIYIIYLFLFTISSCTKNFSPSTAILDQDAYSTLAGLETATTGTYAVLRNPEYVRSIHFLMEYPSDEVAQAQPSSDDLSNIYRYTHLVLSTHCENVWTQANYVIFAANKIIEAIPDNESAETDQLKGENLFLRAMMHFNLVRIFGRPYTQNNGSSLGIPIIKEGLADSTLSSLPRSSVADVYSFVIADLKKSAQLMTVQKNNTLASKEVAQALLSRVYLYMGDNENAILYADSVINSKRYTLLNNGNFSNYFKVEPESDSETIFAIKYIKTQNQDFAAIGSMYYSGSKSDPTIPGPQGTTGYAEVYASEKYINELKKNAQDARMGFIAPYTVNNVLQYNTKLNPATPMYYNIKYNLQDGLANLSSPVYLRLAEMYLNKAEAEAKLGKDQNALNDVNIIRKRSGIPDLTLSSLAGDNTTVLNAVLNERWLEFAFEGQRAYDLFRNNLPMIRNYPGTHSLNNSPTTDDNQTILPTANNIIFPIPGTEISKNPRLIQNPL